MVGWLRGTENVMVTLFTFSFLQDEYLGLAMKSMAESAGMFSGTKKRPRIVWRSLKAFPGLAVSAADASSTSVAKRMGTGPSRMSPSKTSDERCHSWRRTVEVVSLRTHEVSGTNKDCGYMVGKLGQSSFYGWKPSGLGLGRVKGTVRWYRAISMVSAVFPPPLLSLLPRSLLP